MAEGNRLPSLENAPHLETDGEFFVYQHYSVTTILQVVTPISFLKNFILGSSLQYRFSKIIPSFFVDKASCTRQFESELSLHSLASLFPIKEGSTSHLGLLPSGKKRKTALLGARTATLYGWRGIKALRQVVRDGTARGGMAICKSLTSDR